MPRLEITSLDNVDTLRGRAKAMLRQLREERERTYHLFCREGREGKGHIEHDMQMVASDASFIGSYGPQYDVSKFNSLGGALYALDYSIALLEEVLAKKR